MNKSLRITRNLLLVLVSTLFLQSCGYNALVNQQEAVNAQWAQVENVYQRRADLIPNLVETVKGAANLEKETLEGVINARAKATSVNIDANNLSPENIQKFQDAQSGLTQALSRLMVTVERYPDIKFNQNFQQLQSQLEGTENRISVERKKFNEAVRTYNTSTRTFPRTIVASIFGFEKKGYFQAEAGADEVPEVSFD